MIIYWPIKVTNDTYGRVLGLKAGEKSWVVVAVVSEAWDELQTRRARELGVEMIGQALSCDSNQEMTSGIHFWLGKDQLPESCSQSITLVLFQPPKPNRLQYLTLDVPNKSTPNRDLAMQDSFSQVHDQTCLPKAIDLINQVVDIRRALKSSEKPRIIALDRPDDPVLHAETHLLLLLRLDQLCTRLEQVTSISIRYKRYRQAMDIREKSRGYNLFWNTVWLILNDLILGHVASNLLAIYHPWLIAHLPSAFDEYLVKMPISGLRWLNDWPVGLKLNTPLCQFFCMAIEACIRRWNNVVAPLLDAYLSCVLTILSWLSLTGLTTTLALVSDLLSLLSLHLWFSFKMMNLVYEWQVSSLGGLWNLFRGKRWNVARQRTDSYEYDIDQLFLGTLLFTVSAFLFPTVLALYIFLGLLRLGFVSVATTTLVLRRVMNAWPLFELMLRLKEPSRVPGMCRLTCQPLTVRSGCNLYATSFTHTQDPPRQTRQHQYSPGNKQHTAIPL
ncbi:uncharacterized protein L203_102360 [Cryptococcus depauperatus CBS 7841]|uniref:Phosphatidylinositol glycan, class Q n=1 Tax=Cryptococcus depauperatus CBS 7841 TaxID=1295531 RepID=A0AAJ8JRL8_9TREE